MDESETVGICIPTYNQCEYLRETVNSALDQSRQDISVWVSDDASTDNTPQLMRELARDTSRIRYYRHRENLGIAENNSFIMRQPPTKYVIRLDSDDVLEPGYAEALISLMDQYPEAGYGHAAIRRIDEDGRSLGVARLARRPGYQEADEALRASLSGYRVAANVVILRSEALRRLDYYRGRPEFVEDYDLSVRMAAAGYGNVYCDQVLAQYRVWSDKAGTRSKRKHLQLTGYRRIFDEALAPAFAERGWDHKKIERRRKRLALKNSSHCFLPIYDHSERQRLARMLRELGPSHRLEVKMLLLRMGLGPLFESIYHLRGACVNAIKQGMHRIGIFKR